MAKGDGSITQVKDRDGNVVKNRWRIVVSYGQDPDTGKRRRLTSVIEGSKAQARAERDKLRAKADELSDLRNQDKTFAVFAKEWQDSRASFGEVCNHTLKSEAEHIRCFNKHIGNVRIPDITARMIDNMLTAIRKEKSERLGHPVSSTTMHRLHGTLKLIFKQAVNYDLILRNPMDKVKVPKVAEPNRKSLTKDEAAKLLKALNEHTESAYEEFETKEMRQKAWGVDKDRTSIKGISGIAFLLAVRIGIATGMRRGEIFGLDWGAFDPELHTLAVSQSLSQFDDGQQGIKSPKTPSGYRVIHIDAATAKEIERFGEMQVQLLHKLMKLPSDEGMLPESQPLLCSNVGGRCDLRNFQTWWAKFRKETGFPDLKFHELRHTQATTLLANGVDVKTVQTRMGHSNASLTLNWYAHPNPENDAKAATLLETLFAKKQESATNDV